MVRPVMQSRFRGVATGVAVALCLCALPALGDAPTVAAPTAAAAGVPKNNYPTSARVEYVQECILKNGGNLADLYKCSCAIDRMADHLTYDDFVEAGTFARYATLGGEGGGEFRDPDSGRQKAKLYRSLEAEAYKSCGLKAEVLTR